MIGHSRDLLETSYPIGVHGTLIRQIMEGGKILLAIVLLALINFLCVIKGQGSLTEKASKEMEKVCSAAEQGAQQAESTIGEGAETTKDAATSGVMQAEEMAGDLGSKAQEGLEEASESAKEKLQDTTETVSEAFQ